MPNAARDSTGRTFSVWMSQREVDDLGKAAKKEGIKRNEAARRACRAYVSAIADR